MNKIEDFITKQSQEKEKQMKTESSNVDGKSNILTSKVCFYKI